MDNPEITEQTAADEGMTIDALEEAVNGLVDSDSASVDNNTQVQHNDDAEKALNDMRERMGAIEADNRRLVALVGKMVSQYGARLSEDTSANNEAFPSSIEKQFDAPKVQVPSLGDIVLGN